MGLVWRARDEVLHREVALKEVRPPDPDLAEHDPEAARTLRERVLREARALARVDHPHVVTIHHIVDGGEGTYPWLVMELVRGGSLQDRFARGRLSPAEAAELGRGVLAGLRAAHAADIQHRDIKPGNILLRPDGRPVLTDFGIAAVQGATALTVSGSVIGTPDYMAPERVSGEEGGPAADLWSLALTLYVAVEGHHPLRRGNTLATLAAVLSEDVPPSGRAGPLAKALSAVLVRDPAERPDAAALDRLLAEAERSAAAGTGAGAGTGGTAGADGTPGTAGAGGAAGFAGAGAAPPSVTSYSPAPPRPASPPVPAPPHAAPYGPTPPAHAPYPAAAPGPPAPAARRGRRLGAYAAGAGAVALVGALLWTLLPDGGSGGGDGGNGAEADGTTTGDDSGKAEKLTIGVKTDQPGIGLKAPDGTYSGFDVDTATYLAEALGRGPEDIEWREVSAARREDMIQNGQVDFVVATYLMNDSRSRQVDFVGPYLVAHQDVLLRADESDIDNAQDLNGKPVCAITGSTPGQNLRTNVAPQAELVERSTYTECVAALKSGTVDAVTTDDAILAGYAATEPPGTYKLGGFGLSDERYGIGLPKNSPYKEDLTAALKKMTTDGTWAKALRKNLPALPVEPPTVE
ncbi:bifunctional serine/threonine-protein kinase/glutamate ABC transporter substrate-binding protein [Streptomyces sp. NPDC054784]